MQNRDFESDSTSPFRSAARLLLGHPDKNTNQLNAFGKTNKTYYKKKARHGFRGYHNPAADHYVQAKIVNSASLN